MQSFRFLKINYTVIFRNDLCNKHNIIVVYFLEFFTYLELVALTQNFIHLINVILLYEQIIRNKLNILASKIF